MQRGRSALPLTDAADDAHSDDSSRRAAERTSETRRRAAQRAIVDAFATMCGQARVAADIGAVTPFAGVGESAIAQFLARIAAPLDGIAHDSDSERDNENDAHDDDDDDDDDERRNDNDDDRDNDVDDKVQA